MLPAQNFNGTGVVARPDYAPAETFQKQSAAPALTAPANAASISTWPVFQWTPVDGAYAYHIQVATDPNFSNLVDNQTVDETSYTAASTYPAGQKLYWRVQAEGETNSTRGRAGLVERRQLHKDAAVAELLHADELRQRDDRRQHPGVAVESGPRSRGV